jgi:hypothetical protein
MFVYAESWAKMFLGTEILLVVKFLLRAYLSAIYVLMNKCRLEARLGLCFCGVFSGDRNVFAGCVDNFEAIIFRFNFYV